MRKEAGARIVCTNFEFIPLLGGSLGMNYFIENQGDSEMREYFIPLI